MKKFIVDTGDKKYKVEANTYDEAVSAVKAIQLKDEASPLQTVNALLEDERAAVDAYNVALENLKGKIPDESYAAIEAIRNDENRHIENLQAVVNGNVTEKNLEDSVEDAGNVYVIKTDYFSDDAYLGNAGRSWVTKESSKIDKFLSREIAEKKAKEQSRKYKAYVVTKDSAYADDSIFQDADVENAANLADEIASLLRRNKIEQAKRVLQLLITAMR